MLQVLLFEIYPPLRRVLTATLRRAGYRVTLARSAQEAHQHMAYQTFDVLVCDLDTPSSQHGQLLSVLRTAPCSTAIIILLSPENNRHKTLDELQSHLILSKPIGRATLLAGIQSALRSSHGCS